MDSNESLLYHLVDTTAGDDGTYAEFKTAMQNMQIDSVFDIASMSQEDFADALAPHSAVDAQQIYDKALERAHMISRLYYEQQVSPDAAGQRNRRDVTSDETSAPITYQSMFNENWQQFCHEGDIAANSSPAAYLRALYRYALELENSSSHPDKITLQQRRPDLAELILDAKSTFVERPMLSIVNDTLNTYIQQHLDKSAPTKTIQEMLANEHYPLELPYDLHHHQCLLALGADKPGLGEITYLSSLELPFSKTGAPYGGSAKRRREAQKLMSGLSPKQQTRLTAPYDHNIVRNAYGSESSDLLWDVNKFRELTGLTDEQIEELLGFGQYFPNASTNNLWSERHLYGRLYINGKKHNEAVFNGQQFFNFSAIRLDSMLRMVRLHRCTGIPFAELDTLITNADRAVPGEHVGMGNNTLRALGVHRYMNKRYGITPEEFASLYHDMPTYSCGVRDSLFDQVFSKTKPSSNPLIENNGQVIEIDAPASQATLRFLKAGLDSSVTQDDFILIARLAKKHLISFKHDLASASAIYRQARISQMFGLSPSDCTNLARLLGGEGFCKLLVTGTVRDMSDIETDIFDVLIAMDWAVDWLKENNYSVAQWCRLLDEELDKQPLNPELEKRIKAVQESPHDADDKKIPLVHKLLHDVAFLSKEKVPCVMKLAETNEVSIFNEMTTQWFVAGKKPPSLARALRATEAMQALLISDASLLKLLNNPAWLAPGNTAALTPQTQYLLDRFSTCTRHHVHAEAKLLTYFEQAHGQLNTATVSHLNKSLAELLDWTTEEVTASTSHMQHHCARSMNEVDWVIRCKKCCKETGLTVNELKLATRLHSETSSTDWKTLGEALLAAHA